MAKYATLIRRPWESGHAPFRRATTYQRIQDGLFPAPVKIGRMSAWPAGELASVNEALVQGKSDAEVRQLVTDLVGRRNGRGGE